MNAAQQQRQMARNLAGGDGFSSGGFNNRQQFANNGLQQNQMMGQPGAPMGINSQYSNIE